jgi:exopolyphosphatase/guanosine-5'-triphosphate,3'-diphosphate pyrophosphatase
MMSKAFCEGQGSLSMEARSVGEPVFAAVDLGSHTIRLLVAACQQGQFLRPLCLERRVTRLAQGFDERAALARQRMSQSLEVMQEYAALMRGFGATSVVCGATGVVRKARNGKDLLQSIEEQTGIMGTILSEEAEATLSVKGVLSGLTEKASLMLAFDLGGSSTEFTLVDPLQSEPLWATSVFVGAATVTETHLMGDPPAAADLETAADRVRQALAPAFAALTEHLQRIAMSLANLQLVGTAGTVTTLAAMHLQMAVYQPYRVNGLVLQGEWIGATLRQLARQKLADRRRWVGLERDREDIILGGALIVCEILSLLHKESLVVTDAGLLEGLLLDSIETALGWPHTLVSPFTWIWSKETDGSCTMPLLAV